MWGTPASGALRAASDENKETQSYCSGGKSGSDSLQWRMPQALLRHGFYQGWEVQGDTAHVHSLSIKVQKAIVRKN